MLRPVFESPYATSLTKTGKVDAKNRKPFRTARQKKIAREQAYLAKDGTWRSNAPVSYNK